MSNKDSINALRLLGVDMINKANSGHPGIVLGAAPMMYTLYTEQLNYNPAEPSWFNRDRFIMGAGHGSALLYSMLHLSGHNLSMGDLKDFRQWGSKTPGHPEFGHTEGVDATSGPLGQGIAMATGMAIAESYLGASFNKKDMNIVDHYTYVLCGDGDLQEGVTQEAISLAGHLGLGKLVVLYDSNDIQLDGPVDAANSENSKQKYEAMNWQHILIEDGEATGDITAAIDTAKANTNQPCIIEIKTVIGHGSPLAGDCATHGSPIGDEDTVKTRENLCYPSEPFTVADDVYTDIQSKNDMKGIASFQKWTVLMNSYKEKYPEEYAALQVVMGDKEMSVDLSVVADYLPKDKVATRASSGEILKKLQEKYPQLIGGSADLTKSTKVKGIAGDFSKELRTGRNLNFGVREHAMAAINNGLSLHGLKGFVGGFFIFSDYMKPAMRMSALMGLPAIFAFTHDSVAVGEDGPTHEPVEQLSGLRAVPNMDVIRPADVQEVKVAWKLALESTSGPTCLILTRQGVPLLDGVVEEGVAKGGYVIAKEVKKIDVILIATGSEVALAIDAKKALIQKNIDARVVSLPSFKRFNEQSEEYQESVLPSDVEKRVSIEMGASLGWGQYVGLKGRSIAIDTFGASAPGGEVVSKYGFNVDDVVEVVTSYM
jgi:transketolase